MREEDRLPTGNPWVTEFALAENRATPDVGNSGRGKRPEKSGSERHSNGRKALAQLETAIRGLVVGRLKLEINLAACPCVSETKGMQGRE